MTSILTPADAAALPPVAAAAVGALLGAAVGDAAGAFLEFAGRPDAAGVQQALRMPGGGVWRVSPGQARPDTRLSSQAPFTPLPSLAQITDDTELAISQADGLLAASQLGTLDLDALAAAYRRWFHSPPFDIGNATRTAFGGSGADTAAATQRRAARGNADSKANGAVMRATPLCVWAHRLSAVDAGAAGAADSSLSHPNASAAGANAAYVAAVAHLVGHPGDADGALSAADAALAAGGAAYAEPTAWLADARAGVVVPSWPQDGFVKIAFSHAFRHLKLRTPYRDAIAEVLLAGGDTDTNACIVGGVLGALHGIGGIDHALWQPVLALQPEEAAQPRPAWLAAARLPQLARALLDAAPEQLTVLGGTAAAE
jgi:ADP-ribosyl-[dinitrogen reductase] hydrolase